MDLSARDADALKSPSQSDQIAMALLHQLDVHPVPRASRYSALSIEISPCERGQLTFRSRLPVRWLVAGFQDPHIPLALTVYPAPFSKVLEQLLKHVEPADICLRYPECLPASVEGAVTRCAGEVALELARSRALNLALDVHLTKLIGG